MTTLGERQLTFSVNAEQISNPHVLIVEEFGVEDVVLLLFRPPSLVLGQPRRSHPDVELPAGKNSVQGVRERLDSKQSSVGQDTCTQYINLFLD